MNPVKIATLLYTVLLIIILTPYIKYFGIGTNTDVQIYPLIASSTIVLLSLIGKRPVVPSFFIYCISFILIIFFSSIIFDKNYYMVGRGMFGYLSVVINAMAIFYYLRVSGISAYERVIKFVFFAWMFVGVIQLLDPNLFTFWRDKIINVNGRGSVSLSTEPAYFSFALILMALNLYIIERKNSVYIIYALLASIIIAKSSVGVLYSVFIVSVMYRRKYTYLLPMAMLFFLGIILINNVDSSYRISSILRSFVANPLFVIETDASVGLRWINIALPIHYFIDNNLLPHGVVAWQKYLYDGMTTIYEEMSWSNYFLSKYSDQGSSRILGIHGRLLFELGIFSAYMYYFLLRPFSVLHDSLFYILAMLILFLNGVTLGNPFLGATIGTAYYYYSRRNDHVVLPSTSSSEDS